LGCDKGLDCDKVKDLARILIYGDIHLSSRNYGAHRDYPKESLHYLRTITEKAEELGATHLIGLGDLTYGRFHTLEYREAVENELERQFELVNGNRYEIKGNHDKATYGMTEFEYYINKGLIRESTNLKIGDVNISMVDYGQHECTEIIPPDKDKINIVLAHDYFKFSDTKLPEYGKAIQLDEFISWFGVDYLIVGHIHNQEIFEGLIIKDGIGNRTIVHYLGCLSRPAYREGYMEDTGALVFLTIRDNGEMQYDIIDIPLWDLDKSFNLALNAEEKEKKKEREQKKERSVDISDIVQRLDMHERNVGNPEDIIRNMEGIDEKYKDKAIELLKDGGA